MNAALTKFRAGPALLPGARPSFHVRGRRSLYVAYRAVVGIVEDEAVLDTVMLLGTLAVVEAVQGAHEVAGDAADALEGDVPFLTAALGAAVVDDAVEPADGVARRWVTGR